MSVQDNPISFESDSVGRRLSYMLIHGEYMRLLIFPRWLCYDYSLNTLPLVCDWADLRLLSPLAGYSLFAFLVARLAAKKDGYGLLLAAQFVLVFLPMSNIFFPVGTVVGERLLYIPSVSLVLLAVRVFQQLALTSSSSAAGSWRQVAVLGVMAVVAVLLAMRARSRTEDWKSADHLVMRDGALNLKSSKTQFNLGVHHFSKKNYDEAFVALERSWKSDPEQRDAIAFWRGGQVELLRGNLENAAELLAAATTKYGARLMVKEEEVFHDAGLAKYHVGKLEEAKYYLTAALTLNRQFPKALNNYGCLEFSAGNLEIAMNAVFEAAHLKPKNVIYWGNSWVIAQKLGLDDIALLARQNALAIQADFKPSSVCIWEFKPASGGPGVVDDDLAEEEEQKRLAAAKLAYEP
jgi:tetratricopeptide (TPR) repeat protein